MGKNRLLNLLSARTERSLWFVLLFSLAAAFGTKTLAANSNSAPQYNFVFVLDTSVSMDAHKALAAKFTWDLVDSGFRGVSQPGDSVDIWTYDQENHISKFPPEIWDQGEAQRIAGNVARFINLQKFKGGSRFASVAKDLNSLLPHSRGLMVLLLTDGEEPISGISLDVEINDFIAREKKRRGKELFLISMAASNGRFTGWAAYKGRGPITLAEMPSRPAPKALLGQFLTPETIHPEPEKEIQVEPVPTLELPPGAKLAVQTPKQLPTVEVEPALEIAAITQPLPEHSRNDESQNKAVDLEPKAPASPVQETVPPSITPAVSDKQIASKAAPKNEPVEPVVTEPATKSEKVSAPEVVASKNNSSRSEAVKEPKKELAVDSVEMPDLAAKIQAPVASTNMKRQVAELPQTNEIKVVAKAHSKPNSGTTDKLGGASGTGAAKAPVVAAPQKPAKAMEKAPNKAEPAPVVANASPARVIYIVLGLGGLFLAISGLMLVKKFRGRHATSIISRSLQQL